MRIEQAPVADEEAECAVCDAEGTYVLYDGDKVCANCGHAPSAQEAVRSATTTVHEQWVAWRAHRREEYEGWTGPDRIKFPGGFVSAYDL